MKSPRSRSSHRTGANSSISIATDLNVMKLHHPKKLYQLPVLRNHASAIVDLRVRWVSRRCRNHHRERLLKRRPQPTIRCGKTRRQVVIAIASLETVAGGVSARPHSEPSPHRERLRTAFRAMRRLAMPKRPKRNRRIDAPHVRLYRWMLDSPTYLSLSCQARAVLLEIARGHDGTNNGRLGLSVRRAAERCNIAKDTASRAFKDLEERGFVDCVTRGAFNRKSMHATEWRLTWWTLRLDRRVTVKAIYELGKTKHGPRIYAHGPNW